MSQEIEQIKQRLDIVEVVQEYLPLKRSGSNFKGLCPFHQEKSASFMVSQAKQIWHCFGCHKGGDLFSFVQEMEGLDFFEVLKLLGQKAGVKIERKKAPGENKKQPLLNILELSAEFYHKLFKEHAKAQIARDYVQGRRLSEQTIDDFQIGYSPDAWDVLLNFLQSRGINRDEIIKSGMLVVNQEKGRVYDRFRHRLMIPLKDVFGNVVGFTARTLKEDEPGGKYINTPQTEVYDKSGIVYGLDSAKKAIKDAGYAVIVEGNMDVVSSHQAGVKNVVAVSGTALTEAQLNLLKRFTQTLIFSFDADSAGIMAMRRGVELALQSGFEVKVLTLKAGKDPDECISTGVDLWTESIAEAKPVIDFLLDRASLDNDLNAATGKKNVAKDVLTLLRLLQNPIEQDHYLQKLAALIQVSEQSLRQAFAQINQVTPRGPTVNQENKLPQAQGSKQSDDQIVAWDFLALIVLNPKFMQQAEEAQEMIQDEPLADLYKNLEKFYIQIQQAVNEQHGLEHFSKDLKPELQQLFNKVQLYADKNFAELEPGEQAQSWQARLKFLKQRYLSRQLQRVQTQLQDAEKSNDMSALQTLSDEFHRLTSELQSLN